MNAITCNNTTPSRLLFLCRSESTVRMDAKSLRVIGAGSVFYATSQDAALKHLEQNKNMAALAAAGLPVGMDAIICDEQMAQMPASAFLYALSRTPGLNTIPVLVIASGAKSADLYRTAGVETLERPYTPDQLKEALARAMSPDRSSLCPEAFELAGEKGLCLIARERAQTAGARKQPLTTTDLYKQGMALLKQQDYPAAREIFLQVLARQEDHLESCLALARTHQAEQNTEGVQSALLRAAAVCIRKNDLNRATHIASMLPVGMRNNIFAHEALVRMRMGEYRQAALSFLEAGKQRPDQPLHSLIARACLLTTDPEKYMARICEALNGLGHQLTATALRRRLLDYPELRKASRRSGWLDKYPRLKEAVSVASYAAWAWKQA